MLQYEESAKVIPARGVGVRGFSGGRWVAKILVADDNSNIQRMVGLALKDQGIDVVAVGNGEAAVRKISEIRPDLVLADVFMPVRSGYEVCEYVKQDASLSHIPVILLVGAFDPLDEQEAQRVGADGVLKKPFVPPDPLIAMVKAALEKAGVPVPGAASSSGGLRTTPGQPTPPPPFPSKAVEILSPRAPAPTPISSPLAGISFRGNSPAPTPFPPSIEEENFTEAPSRPEPVKIDAAKNTMAFGSLLEPVSADEEPEFVSNAGATPHTNSGWRDVEEPDEVPEEEDEEVTEPAWRPEIHEAISGSEETETPPATDWRESPIVESVGRKSAREVWESAEHKDIKETAGFATAEEVPNEVPPEIDSFVTENSSLPFVNRENAGSFVTETEQGHSISHKIETADSSASAQNEITSYPANQAVLSDTVNESKPEAALHKTDSAKPASTQAPPTDTWPSNYSTTGTAPGDGAAEAKTSVESHSTSNESVGKENATEIGEKKPTSWISRLLSPWESEGDKSNPLATAWDNNSAAKTETAPPPPQQIEEPKAAEYPETEHVTNERAADEQVTDAHIAGNQDNLNAQLHQPSPSVEAERSEEIPSPATASPSKASAETYVANANGTNDPEMDAVVANVLSKLSPEVLQAVTREILKPVIAAMVAEEMKSKK